MLTVSVNTLQPDDAYMRQGFGPSFTEAIANIPWTKPALLYI